MSGNNDVVGPSIGMCTVALRTSLLGEERALCRCSRHQIPYVSDIEYDEFIQNHAPPGQLIIVSVMSSFYPESSSGMEMLEKLHSDKNRNRTRPCMQSRSDSCRVLLYDMATAAEFSDHTSPLLLRRHNVVTGMFLMYEGGKLFFCDHIFNGYGNARKDLQKQMMITRRSIMMGQSLPKDFHFSPQHGRSGPRSAWGGQIGGAGVDHHGNSGFTMELVKKNSTSSLSSGESMDVPYGYKFRREHALKGPKFKLKPLTERQNGGMNSSMKHVRQSLKVVSLDMLPSSPRKLKPKLEPVKSHMLPQVHVAPPTRDKVNAPPIRVR